MQNIRFRWCNAALLIESAQSHAAALESENVYRLLWHVNVRNRNQIWNVYCYTIYAKCLDLFLRSMSCAAPHLETGKYTLYAYAVEIIENIWSAQHRSGFFF